MSTRISILSWAVVVVTVAVAPSVSLAQRDKPIGPGDLKVTAIAQKLVEAPSYGDFPESLGSRTSVASKRWLKVEATFSTTPEWCDELTLKYYVLMGKGQERHLYVGEVTHVNVARGQNHYSAVFIHPNTLDRYGAGQPAEAVAVVLSYQNRPLDAGSNPSSNRRWWETLSPVTGYVLSPDQTPWSVIAFKRYEAIKPR